MSSNHTCPTLITLLAVVSAPAAPAAAVQGSDQGAETDATDDACREGLPAFSSLGFCVRAVADAVVKGCQFWRCDVHLAASGGGGGGTPGFTKVTAIYQVRDDPNPGGSYTTWASDRCNSAATSTCTAWDGATQGKDVRVKEGQWVSAATRSEGQSSVYSQVKATAYASKLVHAQE